MCGHILLPWEEGRFTERLYDSDHTKITVPISTAALVITLLTTLQVALRNLPPMSASLMPNHCVLRLVVVNL